MSSCTYGYGVDLTRLTAVQGSGDANLLSELVETAPTDPFAEPGEPTICDGLQALIDGNLLDSYEGRAQQLYALELLCQRFGKQLDGQEHIGYLEDLGWETAAMEQRSPLDLPAADDFPMSGYLTADEVVEEYARLKDEEIEDEPPELADAREEFVWWLKQCADKGLALVTFTY